MKKAVITLALVAGMMFAVSCEGNKRCPAYSSISLNENVNTFHFFIVNK